MCWMNGSFRQIQPLQKGGNFLIRLMLSGFTNKEDTLRVMQVLPKYLGRYGLTLNLEKTRLIKLDCEKVQSGHENKTFDFLGFIHYLSMSRKGKRILKRKGQQQDAEYLSGYLI